MQERALAPGTELAPIVSQHPRHFKEIPQGRLAESSRGAGDAHLKSSSVTFLVLLMISTPTLRQTSIFSIRLSRSDCNLGLRDFCTFLAAIFPLIVLQENCRAVEQWRL